MRTIRYILQKEFIQIFRDRVMLPVIFIVPLVQLIVLVYAATLEMKNIEVVVVDNDMSSYSRRMVSKFGGSPFFRMQGFSFSINQAEDRLRANDADMVLHIPRGFERDLVREGKAQVQILLDAVNATSAGLANAYATSVIRDFNSNILVERLGPAEGGNLRINIMHSFWYNPDLDYKIYMLPGILVILVTVIGMILTALNLVREKELGTAEQINVTPIRKYQFIVGKLVPFWIIALLELSFGLFVGKIFFRLPTEGSFLLLFAFASLYLFVAMGIGLFLSAISNTQMQVMFVVFFFLVTFILMAGVFTPAESMPDWAIRINTINPMAYFIKVNRMILLKGSGFGDISREFYSLGVYSILILFLATWRYRKAA